MYFIYCYKHQARVTEDFILVIKRLDMNSQRILVIWSIVISCVFRSLPVYNWVSHQEIISAVQGNLTTFKSLWRSRYSISTDNVLLDSLLLLSSIVYWHIVSTFTVRYHTEAVAKQFSNNTELISVSLVEPHVLERLLWDRLIGDLRLFPESI